MHILESVELGTVMQKIWEPNRESIRRLLIGLARDIDLADDLLQETYLRASDKIATYRGGDARAWLAAIAKNLFHAHVRRASVRREMASSLHDEPAGGADAGTTWYLGLMDLRQAVSSLSPTLRTALVMKHYGGFTYQEIAERLGCPVGTAKWRVREALGKLRAALGVQEAAKMKCHKLAGTRVLDYLYGVADEAEREEVLRHIKECASCRTMVDELQKIAGGLDALEGGFKMMHIVDIDQDGLTTLYTTTSIPNESGEPGDLLEFEAEKDIPLDHVLIGGEECYLEVAQSQKCDHRLTYSVSLPAIVHPGRPIDLMSVSYGAAHEPGRQGTIADRMPDGSWHYLHQHAPGDVEEFVFVIAIRLPSAAELSRSHAWRVPSGDEVPMVKQDGALTWRVILAPGEQLDCELFYMLP